MKSNVSLFCGLIVTYIFARNCGDTNKLIGKAGLENSGVTERR